MKVNKKVKELETLAAINIAFVLCYFVFKNNNILKAEVIFTFICLIIPAFLSLIHVIWFGFFSVIGKINATILLAVIFFLFLTPIAWLQKIFKGRKKNVADNFVVRNHTFIANDLERMG
jgi:hypothetical protein